MLSIFFIAFLSCLLFVVALDGLGWDTSTTATSFNLKPTKDRAGAPEYHLAQLSHARSYFKLGGVFKLFLMVAL